VARFVGKLALFLCPQLALLVVIVALGGSDSGNYLGASIDKHRRMLNTIAPRIVFVGGSSAAFSLDSPRIEKEVGRTTVNLGLHAGLGLDYILNECPLEVLGTGDLVVLNLEYEHFCLDGATPDVDLVVEAVKARPAGLLSLDGSLLKELLDQGLAIPTLYLREMVARLDHTGVEKSGHESSPYSRSAFNAWGDVTAHWRMPVPVSSREKLMAKVPVMRISEEHLRRVISRLNEFAAKCRARGADVVLAYPAYPECLFQRNKVPIQRIAEELQRSLRFRIINEPEQAVAPAGYFFDTYYHLNLDGVEWRSSHLIKRLQAALARVDGTMAAQAHASSTN
jgi:hypothetical protein